MSKGSPGESARSKVKLSKNPRRFENPDYLRSLFAAGTRASSLGVAVLDSQTRFESVNASLARESQAQVDHHVGKTSREIIGDLAKQIEPTYESVLRTRKSAFVLLSGRVRDTPEFGYWSDYCFPIMNGSGHVQHLGLFVVNITAEQTAVEIFDALPTDSKRQMTEAAGILTKFDESIMRYHMFLRTSFEELASPFTEPGWKVDRFRSSIRHLDYEISGMRELIYKVISQFAIPRC